MIVQHKRQIISLAHAPQKKELRILEIRGGEGLRRRLLALGFHRDDIIELDSEGILRGPLLIKNITNDTSVALGRGVAHKIMVEVIDG
jgi:Fe2+ transport system protein FeoA